MQTIGKISLPHGVTAKVVSCAELDGSTEWRRAFRDKCKAHRCYEIFENTLANDFEYRYWLLQDSSGNIRAIQPMFFVRQNLVEGVPGRVRAIVDFIRKRFPRFLTMRVLMVGCAAGEGHLGACDPADEATVASALHKSLQTYARQNKAGLVVLKDFPAKYRPTLADFSSNGFE